MNSNMIFLGIFFWLLLVGARLTLYALNFDIALKRRLWPIIIIALGMALIWSGWLLDFPSKAYYFLLPITALVIFVNLRGFYFCDGCKRMVANKRIVAKVTHCERCGAALV